VVFRQAVAERSFECLTRGYTGCGAAHAQYHRTEEFQSECRRGTSDHSCSDERSKLKASGNTQSAAHQTTEGRTYARRSMSSVRTLRTFSFQSSGVSSVTCPSPLSLRRSVASSASWRVAKTPTTGCINI